MEVEYEPYPADATIRWSLDAADEAAAKGATSIVLPETSHDPCNDLRLTRENAAEERLHDIRSAP
jgi:predicted amidohydrolase